MKTINTHHQHYMTRPQGITETAVCVYGTGPSACIQFVRPGECIQQFLTREERVELLIAIASTLLEESKELL